MPAKGHVQKFATSAASTQPASLMGWFAEFKGVAFG